MKKALAQVAAAVLFSTAAVGCGGSEKASPTTTKNDSITTTTLAPTTSIPPTTAAQIQLTAAQVVEGLRAAGLPIGAVEVFDEATDPNQKLGRPGQYVSKASFADARIGTEVDGVDGGGDVESFDEAEALTSRADYLKELAEQPLIGGWYQYTAGNVILRIPFALTPDQAEEYNTVLQGLFQ